MVASNKDPNKPNNDEQLLDWAVQLYEEGDTRQRPHQGLWWENIATYNGDFWAEWNPHTRKLFEPEKPDHKVRIPINLAQPVVRTEHAKLVKNRPIIDMQPTGDEREDLNAAKVADKIYNIYVERKFNMPRVRRRALNWVLVCGYGGIFVDYDPEAQADIEIYKNPEGETVFDMELINKFRGNVDLGEGEEAPNLSTEMMARGELVIKPLSPFQLIWDFTQLYVEDAAWLIITDIYDCNEAERRFGKRPEPDNDIKPGVIEQRVLARFDATNSLNVDPVSVQEVAKVHRLFVKPDHPYFPKGLHLVYTDDEILLKEDYPRRYITENKTYFPLAAMGHVPSTTTQYATSVLQQVRPVVLELSRTESQLIENRNLMANPPWMIPKQLRIEKEIVNKPGLQIRYQHIPNIPPPSPTEMPEMPNYVQALIETLKNHVLEISGQGETSQGRVPPGARSGVAIAYLQEEDDTRLGPTVTEFEEMMELTADITLSVIATEYDIPRTIKLYRKHSAPEVIDFVGSQIEGVNAICQAGSALPRSKAAKQQFILDLWDRKLEQDPRKVREMLELSAGEPDEWERDIDQAERENRKLMEGMGDDIVVEEWHNHPAHHYIHRQYMKSADFEALDPDIQDQFREHDEEHSTFEQQQQQEQIQLQQQAAQAGTEVPMPDTSQSPNGDQPTPEQAGAQGQNVPEGPPDQYSSPMTPANLVDLQPQ